MDMLTLEIILICIIIGSVIGALIINHRGYMDRIRKEAKDYYDTKYGELKNYRSNQNPISKPIPPSSQIISEGGWNIKRDQKVSHKHKL